MRQIGAVVSVRRSTRTAAASHPNYPAEFDVYIDSNNDGTPDYVVFNLENGGFGTSGQNVVEVFNLHTSAGRHLLLHGRRPELGERDPHGADECGRPDAELEVHVLGIRVRQLLHRQLDRLDPEHDVHARHACAFSSPDRASSRCRPAGRRCSRPRPCRAATWLRRRSSGSSSSTATMSRPAERSEQARGPGRLGQP